MKEFEKGLTKQFFDTGFGCTNIALRLIKQLAQNSEL